MPRPLLPEATRSHLGRTAGLSRRAFLLAALAQAGVGLAACVSRPTASPLPLATALAPASPGPLPTSVPAATTSAANAAAGAAAAAATGQSARLASCGLPPAVAPTPLPYPGYTAQEPSTGLHVTGQALVVDLATYRLRVSGKVAQPLELTFDEVRCLPKVSAPVTLECPGFFIDHQTLAGATLASVLALASPRPDAKQVRVVSVQNYSTSFSPEEALDPHNFLAYEWEGQSLPASHGFPLRLALPGLQGGRWVKWVAGIEVV